MSDETDDLLTLTARTRDLAAKCAGRLQDWRRELAADRLREALASLERQPDRMSANGELLLHALGANAASGEASRPESGENAEGVQTNHKDGSALSALLSAPCVPRDPF